MTEAALSSSCSIADVLADSISKIHVSRCHANSPFIALRIGGNILSKHKSLHEIESQKTLILSLCMSMLFLTFPKNFQSKYVLAIKLTLSSSLFIDPQYLCCYNKHTCIAFSYDSKYDSHKATVRL